MASKSRRPGAVPNPSSKKGPKVGSGGKRRRGLEGRGPTPKAEDRTYHPAYKKKKAAEARAATRDARGSARGSGRAHSGRLSPQQMRSLRQRLGLGEGTELVAGRNPVAEAVSAGVSFTRVLLVGAAMDDDRLESVLRTATALGAPLVEVTRSELDQLTEGAVHQGVAIEIPAYEYASAADLLARAERSGEPPLIVALDSVTDPHNLGAVIRSAGAFGAHGVLIGQRRAASVNATVWKVSAGALAHVPVARETNLTRALKELKDAGCFVVGLDGGSDVTIDRLELADQPLVLVTGAEGAGLSRLVRETCDQIVSIEISPRVESLNAAVATGVGLYEVARRRRTKN